MSDLRVRRHTDGRVAMHIEDKGYYRWSSWNIDGRTLEHRLLNDDDVVGEGWCELLVTELPEPDGEALIDDVPFWDTTIGRIFGDDAHEFINDWGFDDLNEVRSDALKMLAAVAACERYRAKHADGLEMQSPS